MRVTGDTPVRWLVERAPVHAARLGVWLVAMMPQQFTAALPVAVGVLRGRDAFGLALLVEGLVHESQP